MSERSHLRIRRQPDIRRYKYAGVGGSGEFLLPPRDRLTHAAKLTQDLLTASNLGQETRREQGLVGRPKAFVYTFKSEPGHELKLESLERRQNEIEIQAVHMEGNVQVAKVRVPDGQLRAFFKLVKDYQTKAGQRPGRFSNQNLIESISSIGLTTVKELWQDSTPFPEPNTALWWEIWIRSGSGGSRATYNRFRDLLTTVGMRISEQFIAFPERVVTLGLGTQEQLSHSLDVLAEIAELRRAKSLASEYLPRQFQRDFVADAEQRIVPPSEDAPAVLLLDTGVNRGHPLLVKAIDEADVQALESGWGTADHDQHQHGTTMAGIALYGCVCARAGNESAGGEVHRRERRALRLDDPVRPGVFRVARPDRAGGAVANP